MRSLSHLIFCSGHILMISVILCRCMVTQVALPSVQFVICRKMYLWERYVFFLILYKKSFLPYCWAELIGVCHAAHTQAVWTICLYRVSIYQMSRISNADAVRKWNYFWFSGTFLPPYCQMFHRYCIFSVCYRYYYWMVFMNHQKW